MFDARLDAEGRGATRPRIQLEQVVFLVGDPIRFLTDPQLASLSGQQIQLAGHDQIGDLGVPVALRIAMIECSRRQQRAFRWLNKQLGFNEAAVPGVDRRQTATTVNHLRISAAEYVGTEVVVVLELRVNDHGRNSIPSAAAQDRSSGWASFDVAKLPNPVVHGVWQPHSSSQVSSTQKKPRMP